MTTMIKSEDMGIRTLASLPDFVLKQMLQRYSGPALETAREEAARRGWVLNAS